MTKNIIAVSATPRKNGNSDLLCDAFLRGAAEAGHHGEKIRVAASHIEYCTGCCRCISRPGKCAQNDGMNELFPRLIAADVLVLATPVYFHALNGQMKTFMDRTCPIYAQMGGKEIYFILAATRGNMPVQQAVSSPRLYSECLSGPKERGILSITGVCDAGCAEGSPLMQEAFEMGRAV